jgi:hypothetical protein
MPDMPHKLLQSWAGWAATAACSRRQEEQQVSSVEWGQKGQDRQTQKGQTLEESFTNTETVDVGGRDWNGA